MLQSVKIPKTQIRNSISNFFGVETNSFHWSRAMKVFHINGDNTLSLCLFTDVTNSKDLLDSMQAGKLEPEVAFLNASLIPDVFPVLVVAHKTLVAKSRDSLTTRTFHSELVYNYLGSKHSLVFLDYGILEKMWNLRQFYIHTGSSL